MSNKWINIKAFKNFQEQEEKESALDYKKEEPEQTEEDLAEIDRLWKGRKKRIEASKKGWKTRRKNAYLKAFEKFKDEGIQPVLINGELEKRYIIYRVNVPVADIDCEEVFETIYGRVNKISHHEKKIDVESLLFDYLSIKNGLMKKKEGKKKQNIIKTIDRTTANRRNYLKHKEAIQLKQKTYRDKNKITLKEKRKSKKVEKRLYDFNRRHKSVGTKK